LARFQVNRSPVARRRFRVRWFGYTLGFSLLGLGAYLAFSNAILLLSFGSLAVLSFVIYPLYYRWMMEKSIQRVVHRQATPSSFAERTLRATPEGLEQIQVGSESKVSWKLVDDVQVIPTHAFISVDGAFSVVIPRMRLEEAQFDAFLNTACQYIENGSAG